MDIIVLGAIYVYNSNLGYHVDDVSVYSLSGNSGSGYQWNLIKLITGVQEGSKLWELVSINSHDSVIVARRNEYKNVYILLNNVII